MIQRLIFVIILLWATSCASEIVAPPRPRSDAVPNVVRHVDPFIGTSGFGHTFPGATIPFGMVQLSPDTRTTGWENCSGYHGSNPTILGFSHTHLSGTGCPDFGDILFMPTSGSVQLSPGAEEDPASGYRSKFRHDTELASPGFYKVHLDDDDITAELSATARTGVHRYTYSKAGPANIIIDLAHGVGDAAKECELRIVNNFEIEGRRRSAGWARDHSVYFAARFSHPFQQSGIQRDGVLDPGTRHGTAQAIRAFVTFEADAGTTIEARVGISHTDIAGARLNLETESQHISFSSVRNAAREAWQRELSKVLISSSDQEELRKFYTALYHCFISPNILSDVDGRHPTMDGRVARSDFDVYHVFSLWDTFRALHPLFTIVQPQRNALFVRSLLQKYQEKGPLPVWELAANETDCMIGYHSIPVITDWMIKNPGDIDAAYALAAMKHSAMEDRLGLKYYKSQGYIPSDRENEAVSKALEYAYDDWCIAEAARLAGSAADFQYFTIRSQNYLNHFDPESRFFRAKKSGLFASPFEASDVSGYFTEANAWQYSMFVPHDISRLIELLGGDGKFTERLDLLFTTNPELKGRRQVDISGLIGQYAHGNEPSHHVAFLYNYAGAPWKTQARVKEILDTQYSTRRDGLCGNDDCGQMSAWYVMASLGLYAVCPGLPDYVLTTPRFPEARLRLENGRDFEILRNGDPRNDIYIASATLNSSATARSFILHSEILAGGTLKFATSPAPDPGWGVAPDQRPVSSVPMNVSPVPYLKRGERTFIDSTIIELGSPWRGGRILYRLQNESGVSEEREAVGEIKIESTCTLLARIEQPGCVPGALERIDFIKLPYARTVVYKNKYSPLYTADGDRGLVDGIQGETGSFGSWQGFEGVDMELTIDLGELREVSSLRTRFLQSYGSWIFLPAAVEYAWSVDGTRYTSGGALANQEALDRNDTFIYEFSFALPGAPVQARFIRVHATNQGICPPGHPGAGSPCWLFADEIEVH